MFSIAIYGPAKVGKTWLAATSPQPCIFLDAEAGGVRFVPGRKVDWDIRAEPPPPADTEIAVAQIHTVSDALRAISWLQRPDHGWRSVVVDSLSELQMRQMASYGPQMNMELWGRLLRDFDQLINTCRDSLAAEGVVTSYILGERKDAEGRANLMLQGASADRLPYKCDIVGYLSMERKQEGGFSRQLLLAPRPWAVAGARLGGLLPEQWTDPHLGRLAEHIQKHINQPREGQTT